jgi:hypothetical protein
MKTGIYSVALAALLLAGCGPTWEQTTAEQLAAVQANHKKKLAEIVQWHSDQLASIAAAHDKCVAGAKTDLELLICSNDKNAALARLQKDTDDLFDGEDAAAKAQARAVVYRQE